MTPRPAGRYGLDGRANVSSPDFREKMSDRSTEPLTPSALMVIVGASNESVTILDEALGGGMRNPSQSYYWTEEWQEAEREAMEELRRGEYVSFASGPEAARWLRAG